MIQYDFVAIGPGVNQTWRHRIPGDRVIRLGRSPKGGWAVPWDMRISREHADLLLEGDRLRIRRLATARNAVYLRGEALTDFTIGPGEDFRIGRTVFRVDIASPVVESPPNQPDEPQPSESLWDLAAQPVENRLESLLSKIDEEEEAVVEAESAGPIQGGLDNNSPEQHAHPREEIQSLRAEVNALKAMLEMQNADACQPDPPHSPGQESNARATVEGHVLNDPEAARLDEGLGAAAWPSDSQPEQSPNAPVQDGDSVPVAELTSPGSELESDLGLPAQSSVPPAAVPAQLADGMAFGNYELIDQIHRGGSGQILKARHRHMDRLAAIKILSQTAAQSEEIVARFQSKAKLLGRLNHPNLVATYDAGELDGTYYLIMEHVDGPDLVRFLKDQTFDVPTAVDYITQAAQTLRYAHDQNVIHRNLNPSHLLVASGGVVKVIGWSLALHAGSESTRGFERPGSPVGTLDYMAPEQIVDSCRIDGRADIYSLGCTLFAILAKRVVYPVDWQRRKATAQRYQPAPSLKEIREDVSDLLEEAYQKMMAKDPKDRFGTMDEVIEALDQVAWQVD